MVTDFCETRTEQLVAGGQDHSGFAQQALGLSLDFIVMFTGQK